MGDQRTDRIAVQDPALSAGARLRLPGRPRGRQRRPRRPGRDHLGAGAGVQRRRSDLIEAHTYRMGAHTTSDDPTKYRSRAETEAWRAKDPISRLRTYLMNAGAIDQVWLGALEVESVALAVRIREGCISLPEPRLSDWFDRAYAQTPAAIRRQGDVQRAREEA